MSFFLNFVKTHSNTKDIRKNGENYGATKTKRSFILGYSLKTEKKTLMFIDDESDILEFFSEIFSPQYKVKSYSKMKQAIDDLKESSPSLIIADLRMPDGRIEDLINACPSKSPIIILSGEPGIQKSSYNGRITEIVSKPVNIGELEKTILRLTKK